MLLIAKRAIMQQEKGAFDASRPPHHLLLYATMIFCATELIVCRVALFEEKVQRSQIRFPLHLSELGREQKQLLNVDPFPTRRLLFFAD